HYVGHDNNRDWYMILQPETQAVSKVLYHQWYPQIVYNHHQTGPPWTRIFIPPFADPVNPHIPAGVITGVNLVGQAMHNRFALQNKPGVISRVVFSMWWNGGGRTAPYFHNMVGILSETSHPSPTPKYYDPKERPERIRLYGGRRAGMVSAVEPSIFYPDPWVGGWLHFRDAIDYMITASMAALNIGARLKEDWLSNIYRMGRDAIQKGEAGNPFAWVIPPEQWDPGEAVNLVNVLRRGGVEVQRATADFEAGGSRYGKGSYVIPAAQAFRPYVMDLMEKQEYPDRRLYPGGPPEAPYDLAGWTLPIQMGLRVDRIEKPFTVASEDVDVAPMPPGGVEGSGRFGYLLSHRPNASVLAVNRLLKAGERVSWAGSAFEAGGRRYEGGTIFIESRDGTPDGIWSLAGELGLRFEAVEARPDVELYLLSLPKVAMYRSWVPNMDEGWTRWLLERYEFPLDTLHDADVRTADLSAYDVIILPDQSPEGILNGHAPGTMPEEYVGGLGVEGALALKRYAEQGGTIVALDDASDFAIQQFGLGVRNAVAKVSHEQFFIPGSLIGLRVDPLHPLAFGMQEEAAAFFVRSRGFEIVKPAEAGEQKAGPQPVEVVARYAEEDLLLSGWALGEKENLGGKPAVVRVRLGEGDVILIGFRSQFRGQPRGTFKLLFNPLQGSTIEGLPGRKSKTTDLPGAP
ncbi:MAG: peptidase M14, partial [Acidobacteriota bacterium]